jgi:ribonuclease BN (tRNA processing enzyme)
MSAETSPRMRVTIVGCSGSFPGPQSPASCYLVQAEHEGRTWSMVLDLGSGALGPLQRYLDPTTLDAVVLSHLHADHFLDLCGLYVMQRYREASADPCRCGSGRYATTGRARLLRA